MGPCSNSYTLKRNCKKDPTKNNPLDYVRSLLLKPYKVPIAPHLSGVLILRRVNTL